MSNKTTDKKEALHEGITAILKNKKRLLFLACALVLVLVFVLILANRNNVPRHPSLAKFCSVYNAGGAPSDLSGKVSLLRNLEEYAPNDIYPTIHKMRVTYEQAEKQPNNYFGLEMGITGSIESYNDYTSSHCDQQTGQ